MNHYFFSLIISLLIFCQFSGYCSDDEKEDVYTLEKYYPIRLREEIESPEEQEKFVHIFSLRNGISNYDREQFYEKYGVHYSFQPNVNIDLNIFKEEKSKGYFSDFQISLLNPFHILYTIRDYYCNNNKLLKLEQEIIYKNNLLRELEINGKSVSEAFLLREKSYKERIELLEDTIEKGKESFCYIKTDHSDTIEAKDELIRTKDEIIQEKRYLENEYLRKIKDILKLLGENETEGGILSNLSLLEKLIVQKQEKFLK